MPAKRKRKPKSTPRLPEQLGDEAGSVLGVLALAVLWPARFEGSWVSVSAFGRAGGYLGDRQDRESLKAAVRRGLRDIAKLADPPTVRTRRTKELDPDVGRVSREEDRCILEPMPLAIELWILREGETYISRSLWQEFVATEYRPAVTLEEVTAGLEETVIQTLLGQGRADEAIARARSAISAAGSDRDRRPLRLALATCLGRRGTAEDWRESRVVLGELSAHTPPMLDHRDRLARSRILVASAYGEFFLKLRGAEPATAAHSKTAAKIRALLDEAASLSAQLSLSDRAQVANLEGLLRKWEAQVEPNETKRVVLYDQAERFLRQALAIWRLARDSYGLGVALYNIGELKFSRYRLHLGYGEEGAVRDALVWYEASIRYTEALGSLRQWALDYAKAAECLALLLPHLRRSRDEAASEDARRRAAAYLAAGREVVTAASWQDQLFDRVERLLQTAQRPNP
jgi:hypothetical protein